MMMMAFIEFIVTNIATFVFVFVVATSEARPPPHVLSASPFATGPAGESSSSSSFLSLTRAHDPILLQQRHLQQSTTNGNGEAHKYLRNDLLQNYDRGSFPWEYAWEQSLLSSSNNSSTSNTTVRRGLDIQVGINFHRVFSVDIINSVADLIVWFRQSWVDPRLAWDPQEYNGTTTTWFWIGDGVGTGETSEIWTPDLELWNMASSLKETLTDSFAVVSSDGTVFWSRPGHLRPACRFQGLDSFPFDALLCTIEFGSWSFSGLYLRPTKMDEGFTVGGSETAGEAFAEYQLTKETPITCRESIYPPFPAAPEEDWPVLLYDIRFYRSWEPYARGYIVMQVILNLAGFSTFWLPVQCGERIALAITALLAAVASELVVAASLPSSSEMTWFQTFSLFSLAFGAIALFESVAVIFFFYYTGSDLVPTWWKWIRAHTAGKTKLIHSYKHKRTSEAKRQDGSTTEANAIQDDDDACENDVAAVGVSLEQGNDEVWDSTSVGFKNDDEAVPFPSGQGSDTNGDRAERRPSIIYNARDADDFIDNLEAEHNKQWKTVSQRIDEVCRVVIIPAYIIVLAVLLQRPERL